MAPAEPSPAESPPAAELCQIFVGASGRNEFVVRGLAWLRRRFRSQASGLIRQIDGRWVSDCWSVRDSEAPPGPLPTDLISDAMDQHRTLGDDRWIVAPLAADGGRRPDDAAAPQLEAAEIRGRIDASAIVLFFADRSARDAERRVADHPESLVLLASLLLRAELAQQQDKRIAQLKHVLRAAASWQRLEDVEELLHAIADTACQLLQCDRASIFLWDRRRGKLIGRPALGVDGKPLEVDDDAGVVGEVLQSSEPKIWNAGSDDEQRVNRRVDRATDFHTESLIAVPMVGGHRRRPSGEKAPSRSEPVDQRVIGVFEALNRRDGGFEQTDVAVLEDLATHAGVAIESLQTRRKLVESRDRLVNDAATATQLIGDHPAVQSVRQTANKVAATELGVLVLGENGTGKEVLAKHIHYESGRRSGPFVAVNCAALVESLLESELFGHEKGAFTDAQQTRPGKFELASGGTLFLDEVGDMSPGGQAKLLRVLEEKVVVRVGGSQPIPVDTRVLAATNQPLQKLVEQKRFREDLFFRLNVVSLTLPPLRDRGADVLLLCEHFLSDFCYQIGRSVPALTAGAKQALLSYRWPGNVRELRNTIERVCYLASGQTVDESDLMLPVALPDGPSAAAAGGSGLSAPLADATRDFQVAHIGRAIDACEGNMTEAASQLGLHRSNLYRKMRQLGMPTSGE